MKQVWCGLGQKSTGGLGQSWPVSPGSRNVCPKAQANGAYRWAHRERSRRRCLHEAGSTAVSPLGVCSWAVTSLGQGSDAACALGRGTTGHTHTHTHTYTHAHNWQCNRDEKEQTSLPETRGKDLAFSCTGPLLPSTDRSLALHPRSRRARECSQPLITEQVLQANLDPIGNKLITGSLGENLQDRIEWSYWKFCFIKLFHALRKSSWYAVKKQITETINTL